MDVAHTIFILYCMLLFSILYFNLRSQCLISLYIQFFTCASIRTSEFLRHTTILLIKLLKDIFLHSSVYFMFLATLSAFFWMSSACHFPHGLPGLPGLPGFAEVSWVCGCSLGCVRFDEVYCWHSAQLT